MVLSLSYNLLRKEMKSISKKTLDKQENKVYNKIMQRTNVLSEEINMNVVIISILEIIAVGFTVWCLFNEKKLIAFEKKFIRSFKRRHFKVIKGNKNISKYYA